eukprot:40555-Chlamydomonas_euryale.AAC.6
MASVMVHVQPRGRHPSCCACPANTAMAGCVSMMNTEGRPQGCVSYQPDAEYQTSKGNFPSSTGLLSMVVLWARLTCHDGIASGGACISPIGRHRCMHAAHASAYMALAGGGL